MSYFQATKWSYDRPDDRVDAQPSPDSTVGERAEPAPSVPPRCSAGGGMVEGSCPTAWRHHEHLLYFSTVLFFMVIPVSPFVVILTNLFTAMEFPERERCARARQTAPQIAWGRNCWHLLPRSCAPRTVSGGPLRSAGVPNRRLDGHLARRLARGARTNQRSARLEATKRGSGHAALADTRPGARHAGRLVDYYVVLLDDGRTLPRKLGTVVQCSLTGLGGPARIHGLDALVIQRCEPVDAVLIRWARRRHLLRSVNRVRAVLLDAGLHPSSDQGPVERSREYVPNS